MIRLVVSLAFCLSLIGCSGADQDSVSATDHSAFSAQDSMITVDGVDIRYRTNGHADAPSLVLLHGFTDSLHTWDGLAAELADDFHILRPDLPGHGLSGVPQDGDLSNEALVAFVGAFLEATQTDDAILVGNSLGGLAAWRYAAQGAGDISGLVLLAPGGVPHNGVGDTPVDVPMMLSFYLKNAPEAGVRAALEAMHADPSIVTDAMVAQFADMMKVPGNGEAFVARAGSFTLPTPEANMAKVTVPTLILWGAQDTVLPPSHADVFATSMPNAEVRILDQVGHMPQSEAHDAVATAIREIALQTGDGP